MSTPRPIQLPRRLFLGASALIAAAATLVAKPGKARAEEAKVHECAADIMSEA